MPRTTLTFCALLWGIMAFGQLNISTTHFQGESYNVYPIRIPFDEVLSDHYKYVWYKNSPLNLKYGAWTSDADELTLPFNPFKLKDGKYLVFYEKKDVKWDKENSRYKYKHQDTSLVAATFVIKDNRKSGEAKWYDFKKPFKVVQTGNYTKGVKEGAWNVYRKNEHLTYTYSEGTKHGLSQTFKEGKLNTSGHYIKGARDGEYVSYHDGTTKVKERVLYQNDWILESKAFDKKDRLTYWFTRKPGDDIRSKTYHHGRLIKTESDKDSIGCYTVKTWYKNGSKEDILYKRSTWYMSEKSIFDFPWYGTYQRSMLNLIGSSKTVAKEEYRKNGTLRVKYNARTMDFQQPVTYYNKKGDKYKSYQMNVVDSSLVTILTYHKKTGTPYYKRISLLGQENIMTLRLNPNGDTSYFKASPYYMSIKNPDERGFKKSFVNVKKKGVDEEFTLLHSNTIIPTKLFKEMPLLSATFTPINDTTVTVTLSEFDNKNEFEVEHQYVFTAPKQSSFESSFEGYSYWNNSHAAPRHINHILDLNDSLDYRIMLYGRPFYGRVDVKDKWSKKPTRYKSKVKITKDKYMGYVSYDTNIILKDFVRGNHWYKYNYIDVANGHPIKIRSDDDYASYSNGKKYGESDDYHGNNGHYQLGLRHGLYSNDKFFSEYYKGQKHGLEMSLGYYGSDGRYNNQIEYKAYFNMDTLHGLFQSFVKPEVVSQSVVYENGLPNGRYFRGNLTCPTEVSVEVDHGYLVDTGYYYFSEGILKAKVFYQLKDSVFYLYNRKEPIYITGKLTEVFDDFGLPYRNESFLQKDKIIDFEATHTADYQYFYKNGVMASTGRVENQQKVGIWKHWDLNGQLFKEISYDTGWYFNPATNDTLQYFGKVQMWYPNGEKLLTGLVKEDNFRFKCDQEMKVNLETLHYLSFFTTTGEQTIKDGSGKISEFHNNGETRLIGELRTGKRFGLWKFYDPNGRLQEIGRYDSVGLKDGLWIQGDLEAVPYFENMCIEGSVNAYNYPDIDQAGYVTQKIYISEQYFKNGSLLEREYMNLLPLY